MSKVSRREWYTRVNNEWPHEDYPDGLPALDFDEAVRAYRKLYRFEKGKSSRWKPKDFKRTSGNRRNNIPTINPELGWHSLIHHISHRFVSDHGGEHARCEIRLIKEVVRRGWLDGRLKTKPKAAKPKPDPRDVREQRLGASIRRWEAKERRAANALRKLRRQLRAIERARERAAAPQSAAWAGARAIDDEHRRAIVSREAGPGEMHG